MKVSACLVTRGDVEMQPIIDSLSCFDEIVIWDNGARSIQRSDGWAEVCTDLSVYGRYAAIEYASHDLIYVVDDDVIVSDPQAIVQAWVSAAYGALGDQWHLSLDDVQAVSRREHVVCNMPPEFRHDFYTDHALVGFGAAFHRDAPQRAFDRLLGTRDCWNGVQTEWFHNTCDIVFTGLTPRVLVDIPKTNLPWAEDDNRMYRQPSHISERQRMLDLVRQVRDR